MSISILRDFCESIGFKVSESQLEAFESFQRALYEANRVMNLTRVPEEECVLRHFIDSLLIVDLIPKNCEVLDIGCGPGLPSWPIACIREDLRVVGLDSSGKMVSFLRQHLLPNLRALQGRIEELPKDYRYSFITGRAVAPLPILLEVAAPICKKGGWIVPLRTPAEKVELDQIPSQYLGLELRDIIHRELPGTDIVRMFPIYQKIKQTPTKYPRPWAMMQRKPLSF